MNIACSRFETEMFCGYLTFSDKRVYCGMEINEMIARAEQMSHEYVDGRFRNKTDHTGAFRSVQLVEQYAFKATTRQNQASVNWSEWDFYTMTTDEIRAKLCKPVYISQNGNVLVMERLERARDSKTLPWDAVNNAATELDQMTEAQYGFCIGDLHGGNWGVTKSGLLLALDYGAMEYQARRWLWNNWTDEKAKKPRYAENAPYHKENMAQMLLTNQGN